LTKDEYEALVKGKANDAASASQVVEGTTVAGGDGKGRSTQKLGLIGVAKKRKVGKVVGGEDGDGGQDTKKSACTNEGEATGAKTNNVDKKVPKKKKAKVKIDFGDDEET
jgi:hypothetical protein